MFIVKLCYVKHVFPFSELRLERVSWELANWWILFRFKSSVFHEVTRIFSRLDTILFLSATEDNNAVLVSILQKCRREKEEENVFMGFEIHQVPSGHEVRHLEHTYNACIL